MKINLRGNAAAAAVEQVVVGATFLIFYGLLIRQHGADLVGVLSLVLVLSSIGVMANAGFGGAVARFAPIFEGRGDRASTVRCIETTVLCTAALYAILLLIVFYPFRAMITWQAGETYAQLVADLMVPATLYVFALGVGTTTTLTLTALQRSDLRLWANTAGAILALAIVIWAAPRNGIQAGLWALAAQASLVLIVTWLQLCRLLPELHLVPWRFSLSMARELLKIGANLQVQSLLVAALEPISRLLVGHFGALVHVTYFAMASRFVIQVRALIFAGAQPSLSAFGYLKETDAGTLGPLYARVSMFTGFLALVAMSATAGAAPFVGEVWIGERQDNFVAFVVILAAGWLANTMVLGSYFFAYAIGRMTYNLTSHIVMLVLNLALGPALGFLFGPTGVVTALAIALLASGLIMGIGNARLTPDRKGVGIRIHAPLAISAVLAAGAAIAGYDWLRDLFPALVSGLGSGAIWLVVIAPAMLFHPARKLMLSTFGIGRAGRTLPG